MVSAENFLKTNALIRSAGRLLYVAVLVILYVVHAQKKQVVSTGLPFGSQFGDSSVSENYANLCFTRSSPARKRSFRETASSRKPVGL